MSETEFILFKGRILFCVYGQKKNMFFSVRILGHGPFFPIMEHQLWSVKYHRLSENVSFSHKRLQFRTFQTSELHSWKDFAQQRGHGNTVSLCGYSVVEAHWLPRAFYWIPMGNLDFSKFSTFDKSLKIKSCSIWVFYAALNWKSSELSKKLYFLWRK